MFLLKTLTRALPLLLVIVLASTGLRAELKVDITKGKAEPLPIAVTDFFGSSAEEAQSGADISQVIAADLQRSGLFKPIDKRAFIQFDGDIGEFR